jgi:two-component system, NarL family, response regulator DegU
MQTKFRNIMIVDDHPLIRSSIVSILQRKYKDSIFFEASDGFDALEKLKTTVPELILVDIDMPKMNGIEFLKKIREIGYSKPKVILLTVHSEKELIIYSKKLQANGYLTKSIDPDQFLYFIENVENNDVFIVPTEYYISITDDAVIEFDNILSAINQLTEREIEVMRMMYHGFKNKEIADQLFITVKSVENYKNRIVNKLGDMNYMLNDMMREKSHILRFLI